MAEVTLSVDDDLWQACLQNTALTGYLQRVIAEDSFPRQAPKSGEQLLAELQARATTNLAAIKRGEFTTLEALAQRFNP